jgi:hypothetical protein
VIRVVCNLLNFHLGRLQTLQCCTSSLAILFVSLRKIKKLRQTEMDGPDLVKLFVGIGLSEIKAKETAKNSNVSINLKTCIDAVSKAPLLLLTVMPLIYFSIHLCQTKVVL